MMLRMTIMTVFICGQMVMMISVMMDGSIIGHVTSAASTTYVKRIIEYYHCDNYDLNINANRKKEECIFSISKPKLIYMITIQCFRGLQ